MEPIELKKWRLKNDWSQAQLARVLGVTMQAVSMWERGVRSIPSFLWLALSYLEGRDDLKSNEAKRRKLSMRRGKDYGNDL